MKKRLLLHVLFWIVYVIDDTAIEYAWARASIKSASNLDVIWLALQSDLALLPVKILFTYFVLYVIIDRGLIKNKHIGLLVIWGIVGYFIAIVIHRASVLYIITPHVYHEDVGDQYLLEPKRMLSASLDIGFACACAIVMKLLRTYWIGKEREKSLVKEKLEAELKFLRTQTNPHFLFNTLNNIYALARKKSDDTADVVMKLSKLLRFMLYESRKDRIPLSDEVRLMEDYLELEKIRYNERLTITFKKDIDDPHQEIAPLLLLPFIENAFKHGASETRFDSFIHIETKLKKGILEFCIRNSKENDSDKPVTENIGLSNVRRQLVLMYNEHKLDIENQKEQFSVHLTVNLNSDATV